MLRQTDISSILIAASAACSRPSSAEQELRATRAGQLWIIAETCGLPAHALRVDVARGIRFRPSPDERYEVVDCVLAQLRDSGLAGHMPMAFVGNEAPAEEVGNHAPPN